jgi:hypothetical protein
MPSLPGAGAEYAGGGAWLFGTVILLSEVVVVVRVSAGVKKTAISKEPALALYNIRIQVHCPEM